MHAIYLTTQHNYDHAIEKGISAAGYSIQRTFSIPETIDAIKSAYLNLEESKYLLLVAEVQGGAIPLMMILREQAIELPPTLLLDKVGDDIRVPVQALQFDVEEYLLGNDPDIQRESRARVLAERVLMDVQMQASARTTLSPEASRARDAVNGNASIALPSPDFDWDPVAHIISVGELQLRLSPIQARIFDRLWMRRNQTVGMKELIETVLMKPNMSVEEGVRLLRPHLVRLRTKLEQYPDLAHRIINVRGNGYMMI